MADQWKLSATMVAQSEERSYVFKLPGYSRAKAAFNNPRYYMASPPFSVGGHSFVVRYFPNCGWIEHAGHASFLLVPDSTDAEAAKVNARFTVLGTDGLYVPRSSRLIVRRNGSCVGYGIPHAALERSLGVMIDDCLSVKCDVTVEKDIHGEETMGDRFVVVPPSDLCMHFGNLLESMDGADVTFHVGREMFSAHRYVLAARSPVFKALLLGAMKESDGCTIVIHEMEAAVFKCLLRYMYTDSLPALDVAMATHLLVAADRYDVQRLKRICEHKLCGNVDSDVVANSLALAGLYNCRGLKEACLQFLAFNSNLEAMMASGGFENLKSSCPFAIKELIASLLPAEMKAANEIIMEM